MRREAGVDIVVFPVVVFSHGRVESTVKIPGSHLRTAEAAPSAETVYYVNYARSILALWLVCFKVLIFNSLGHWSSNGSATFIPHY